MNDGNSDPSQNEEWVPEDDRVIGQALKWSLLVLACVSLVVAAGFFLTRDPEVKPVSRAVDVTAPAELAPAAQLPDIPFSDITGEAGIDFVHVNGATGEKLLPETMGGGVAFLDYDNDGDQDLLFVNSTRWGDPGQASSTSPGLVLYANDGTGHFSDMTRQVGLSGIFYGMGVAAADVDGNGFIDLFVTALGKNLLYANRGGRFENVSQSAGVEGDSREWSTSAAFFDYDGDGDLDLFVCNYVRWSRQIDLDLHFTLNGRDRAYGPPTNFTGTYPYMYRNDGGFRFTDVSAPAGVQIDNPATGEPMAKALAVYPIDLDSDNQMDLLVANDTVQNFLFHNLGNGTFQEIGGFAGIGFDSHGKATGAMGLDAAHYRNDRELGVAVANFANEMSSLYVSQEDPLLFNDEAPGEGVGSPSRLNLSFGLFFFDADLDGRLDLLQANGHLEEEINQVQASQHYHQPAQLFWNAGLEGETTFALLPDDRVGQLYRPLVGRGAAFADIDGDGDLDVVLTQTGGAPMLLRNDQQSGHHWLRVLLQEGGSNPAGLGAWVEVHTGSLVQRRHVMPHRSYLSQVELPVTFGLGTADRADQIRVFWPDGSVQQINTVERVDRTLVIRPE